MKVPGLNLDSVTAITNGIRRCYTDTYRVNCVVLWVSLSDTKRMEYVCARNFKSSYFIHLMNNKIFQEYQNSFFTIPTDAHNYKITGMLKQLKFR